MIISTGERCGFDLEAHEAKAEAAAEALAQAEAEAARAAAGLESAKAKLTETESQLGAGKITAAALTKARGELEIAEAVAKSASSRARAAEGAIPNTDHRLADALVPVIRGAVHSSVHLVSVPAELPELPGLADYRPVVVILQGSPAYASAEGWLATDPPEWRGAQREQSVKITWHGIEGLHRQLTAEDLWQAFGRSGVGVGA